MPAEIYIGYQKRAVVERGLINKYPYYIVSLGTHPCAYVEVSQDHPAFGMDYADMDIDCHGGVTYSYEDMPSADHAGWFVGIDFDHKGDCGTGQNFARILIDDASDPCGKKWTCAEIYGELQKLCSGLDAIKEADYANTK